MACRQLWLLAVLALAVHPASAVINCGGYCNTRWEQEWSTVATFGPICMCPGGNSTVVLTWNTNVDRGVFQIPSDACPKDFTGFATDTYNSLASSARQGKYVWQVPSKEGDYWLTSQAGNDCRDGLKAQFRVTSGSSGRRVAWPALAAASAAALLALAAL